MVFNEGKTMAAPKSVSAHDFPLGTLAGRVNFILASYFGGDRKAMARNARVGDGVIRGVINGRPIRKDQVDQLLTGLARLPGINGEWVRTGAGHWKPGHSVHTPPAANGHTTEVVEVPPAASEEEYVPPSVDDATAVRFREAMMFCGGPRHLAYVLIQNEVSTSYEHLVRVRDGHENPTEDELLGILNMEDCPISGDWLLQGDGTMLPSRIADQPVVEKQADPLGLLLGLGEQVKGIQQEVREAVLSDVASALKQHEADVAKAVHTGRKYAEQQIDRALKSLATQGTANSLSSRIDSINRRLSQVDAMDFSEDIAKLTARMTDLDVRCSTTQRATEQAMQAMQRHAVASDSAEEETTRQFRARLDSMDSSLKEMLKRISVLETWAKSMTAPTPSAPAVVTPEPKKVPTVEADLDPGDRLTIEEWCALPGPHQRVLRDNGDRRVAGRRMGLAMDQNDLARQKKGVVALYPVRLMRQYVAWLAEATAASFKTGRDPSDEGWSQACGASATSER
jgi:hypothetical protein